MRVPASIRLIAMVGALLSGVAPWRSLAQPAGQRTVQDTTAATSDDATLGPYYAFVVGVSNYTYLRQLDTPLRDADAIGDILQNKFGFQTRVLHDASREQIVSALWEYRRLLPKNSNLLIYFAGHGLLDTETQAAYWLPVDAEKFNSANWISATDISSSISAIPSQHILIISDSCYSGALSLSRAESADTDPVAQRELIAKMIQRRSRTLLASGGNEPVADGGAEGHSIFASVLLQSLRDMDQDQFSTSDVFTTIQHRVGGRSQQLPQYSSINNSGHDGGDFVFSRVKGGGANGGGGGPVIAPKLDDLELQQQANAILSRYQSAFERKDLGALERMWPGMPARTRKDDETFFEHASDIRMTYKVVGTPVFQATTAQIVFSQELQFKMDGQPQKLASPRSTMTLQKLPDQRGSDEWQISDLK